MRRSCVPLSVVTLLSSAVVLVRPPTAVLAATPTSDPVTAKPTRWEHERRKP
jgi:hypothetical protein